MADLQQDNTEKESTCRQEQPKPDYYIENGLLVFTEAYHLRRGHCCKSGCRHCPYGFKRKK
jgi:hypothetical protein